MLKYYNHFLCLLIQLTTMYMTITDTLLKMSIDIGCKLILVYMYMFYAKINVNILG